MTPTTAAVVVGLAVGTLLRAFGAALARARTIRHSGPFAERTDRASLALTWPGRARRAASRLLAWRAETTYDVTLAAALDAAARSVRSGASLHLAVGEAAAAVRGAVADDLRRVSVAVDRGAALLDALGGWTERRPCPAVRLAAGAMALAVESGGPPGRVLDDVSAALRQRHQIEREAHALAAQARLSALVVGVAPVAFTVVAAVTDPRHARLLFATPVGLACLGAGLALDAVGALWMHRISRSVASW